MAKIYTVVKDGETLEELKTLTAAKKLADIPEGEERISYQMPTFWKGRNIIHYGSNETYLYFFANTSRKTFTFQDANGKISKGYEGGKMDGFV